MFMKALNTLSWIRSLIMTLRQYEVHRSISYTINAKSERKLKQNQTIKIAFNGLHV